MQNGLNHVSDRSSHLTSKCRFFLILQRSVCGSYYAALSSDVIHDIFVLFTFASMKAEVIWFDTLVSDHQSLALFHVLHINWVSVQTFGLRQKFETLVSVKDSDPVCQ